MTRNAHSPPAPGVTLRDLLRLAGPIFIAQLAVMGLAVIDTVMAGRLSATDLAAVAIGMSIYSSAFIGLMGVLQALTPIAGHHFGAGRWHEVGEDLVQGNWLALALALIGMPILLFNWPWLRWVGLAPDVAAIAHQYLLFVALGLPGALLARSYIALNSAVSRPNVAMAINVGMLAAKVPLNHLLIHGAGPLPPLGGAGCGLATALLMWGAAAANAAVWRLDPFYDRFRTRSRRSARPRWRRQKELLKLGVPSGVSLLIEVTSFTFIAILIARLGAVTIGGHHIIANIVSLLFMIPLALGIATGVLVAQCLGAGEGRQAQVAARRGWNVSMITSIVAASAVWICRGPLVNSYTTDAAVAELALSLMALAVIFHVFDAMQGAAGLVLRGYKVAFAPMLIHSAALWGVGLLGGYVLAYYSSFGKEHGGAAAFWTAAIAGIAMAGVALSWLASRVARRHVE